MNKHLNKEDIQKTNNPIKMHSSSYVIRALQTKTTERYCYINIRWSKCKKLTSNADEYVEQKKFPFIADVHKNYKAMLEGSL